MNKAHKVVSDYLTNYLRNNNLYKLTAVLADSATLPRGEKYVLNIEEQIEQISTNIDIAIWYLVEFLSDWESDIYYDLRIGRYNIDNEDEFEFEVFYIDNQYIKCCYKTSELSLVKPYTANYGRIDINWLDEQIKKNFHSNVSEVLQDIKNNITPLSTEQVWEKIENTL